MANPSSSHHGERHHRSERERERSHHHHHRTISSTTLLLVLSLVLACLAVMLSLPASVTNRGAAAATGDPADPAASGMWSYLTPKRTQALLARESAVAVREAEVARREAELLIGAPGGVIPSPTSCPPCTVSHTIETVTAPAATIIKEIVKEDSLTPPGWASPRVEDILERELKVTEREREISRREESVNRREHDASRRESWIMEQLIALGNDGPQVEEEYVYEPPAGAKRKAKFQELPPLVVSEAVFEPETKTVIQTQTVTVPAPANTRRAASPTPVVIPSPSTEHSPKTTSVEIVTEEIDPDDEEEKPMRTVTVTRGGARRPPKRWFGGW